MSALGRRQTALQLLSLILCTLSTTACPQAPANRHSILKASGDTIVVLLLDAASANPMAGVAVEVWSDNGIRCVRNPCPTNGTTWHSKADASGKIHIPRRLFQESMSASTAGFAADLAEDAYQVAGESGGWVLDMLPSDSSSADKRPIKLVDASSGRPVASRRVRVDYRTPLSGRDTMTLTSSGLGYIFIPTLGVAGTFEDVWAKAPGYRRTRIDFSGPSSGTTRMRRQ